MIGIFLKNESGGLCLMQPPQEPRREIIAFHYQPEAALLSIAYGDGTEERPTKKIAPELRDAFEREDMILVVHVDENRMPLAEYNALLVRD